MHSILPMLSTPPALTFSLAPYFAWGMLAVLIVAGLAIASSAMHANQRHMIGAGKIRPTSRKSANKVLRHAERPVAA